MRQSCKRANYKRADHPGRTKSTILTLACIVACHGGINQLTRGGIRSCLLARRRRTQNRPESPPETPPPPRTIPLLLPAINNSGETRAPTKQAKAQIARTTTNSASNPRLETTAANTTVRTEKHIQKEETKKEEKENRGEKGESRSSPPWRDLADDHTVLAVAWARSGMARCGGDSEARPRMRAKGERWRDGRGIHARRGGSWICAVSASGMRRWETASEREAGEVGCWPRHGGFFFFFWSRDGVVPVTDRARCSKSWHATRCRRWIPSNCENIR